MSEKPLCGYCYNECTDDCCDKRRIDVLERQLAETEKTLIEAHFLRFDSFLSEVEDFNYKHDERLTSLYEKHKEFVKQLKEQGDE